MRSNAGGVNLVVFSVGAYKPDEENACVVMNFDDEAVAVAFDVKHDAIPRQDISGAVALLDIPKKLPVRRRCFREPCFQGLLGVGMREPEVLQGLAGDDTHGFWQMQPEKSRSKFPNWEL